jgi:hypothetical protein
MQDEELRRMSDRELAALCERAGVMFTQVKAHLAAHYPENGSEGHWRREKRMTEPGTPIDTLYEDLGDDEVELLRELHMRERGGLIDDTCFVYDAGRKAVLDEILRRMSGRELAAWAQRENIMLAQVEFSLLPPLALCEDLVAATT